MAQPVSSDSVPVHADPINHWGAACLEKTGMNPADALQVVSSLVQTSLWGVDSHGIARLPHYLDRLTRGSIVAQPKTETLRTGPGTAYIEGGAGHGIVLSHLACKLAKEMAQETGIAGKIFTLSAPFLSSLISARTLETTSQKVASCAFVRSKRL